MLKTTIPYKILLMFVVFAVVLIVPFLLIVSFNAEMMLGDIEAIDVLSPDQRAVYLQYSEKILDDVVALSFYVFVLAFVVSMFFSRRFIAPIRELYRGAKALREGTLDIRLDVTTNDEFSDVIKVFNEMAESLKKKKIELKRKEAYLEAMVDPMWVIDEDNLIVDVNPAFTKLFGHTREEVVGASLFDFLDAESEKTVRRKLYGSESGHFASYEVSIISKSSGLMPALVSGSPIMEDGVMVGRIGVIKDMRREVALRESLQQEIYYGETIMDSISDPMIVVDRDFRILKANLAARVKAGRHITGEECHRLFHKSRNKCFLEGEECPVKVAFESGESFSTVHEHVETGGKSAFHEIMAYPIRNAQGEVTQVLESIRDVTERKRFEDEIEQRNRELTTLNNISKILSQSLRAEEIFNKVLDRVIGLIGMDGGGIFFLDDNGRDLNCRFHRGLSEDFVRSIGRIKMGEDIPGRVALEGRPVITPDISTDRRIESSILKHSGLKGFACIPMRGKERMIGVFFIFSINEHQFSAEERSTLNSISEMSGLAFENIRLYEKMRELYENQRVRRAEEQKNMLELSSMLTSSIEMSEVLNSALALIKSACRADFAWLLDMDEMGDLKLGAGSIGGHREGDVIYTRGSGSIELYSIQKKEPIKVKGIVSENRFYVREFLKAYSTVYSIPMYVGDKALGAFSIYYSMLRDLSEEEVHFLQTVSSVLAVALERATLYQNVIIQKGMADAILRSIVDGVMSVDAGGRVVSMNDAARGILGLEKSSAEGSLIGELFGAGEGAMDLSVKIEESFNEAMLGMVHTVEANLISSDGKRIPLIIKSSPVRRGKGEIAGVVFVIRDLSREREADSMKTDFVMSVSHEFRTPLTAIVGMAEMLLKKDVSGERVEDYLSSIHSEGLRLSSMVSDVLDIARIESGKETYTESEFDFAEIVKDVGKDFGESMSKKELSFTASVEEGIGPCRGDVDKIKQLLRNLLHNAVTYCNEGASITLDARRTERGLTITVTDTGWGMTEEEVSHAGEKFFRGSHGKKTKGTGLGLSLCGDIARMHGGSIRITSKTGEGTTVVVDLAIGRNA